MFPSYYYSANNSLSHRKSIKPIKTILEFEDENYTALCKTNKQNQFLSIINKK
jgi:hypothetical protein